MEKPAIPMRRVLDGVGHGKVNLTDWVLTATDETEALDKALEQIIKKAASEALNLAIDEGVCAYLSDEPGVITIAIPLDNGDCEGPHFRMSILDAVKISVAGEDIEGLNRHRDALVQALSLIDEELSKRAPD
jgi:hypothetical protein